MAKPSPKRKKFILILALIWVLALAFMLTQGLTRNQANRRMADALSPYMKESFSSEGAAMPANPVFALYDMDRKAFNAAWGKKHPLGTDDPSKVNVVLAYRARREQVGNWVDSVHTGQVYSSAYAAFVDVYVVRLSDWALIEKRTFQSPVTKPDEKKSATDYVDMLGATGADRYINALMDGQPAETARPAQPAAPRKEAPAEAPAVPDLSGLPAAPALPDASSLPAAPELSSVPNLPAVPQ